jgi:hypothetical protein
MALPSSYIQTTNTSIGIYKRSGALVTDDDLSDLTGDDDGGLTDPQTIWDPATNRFYFTVLDKFTDTIHWGFSKSSNPSVVPDDFCRYNADFGYSPLLPDYPKLGTTRHNLLIGVNTSASITGPYLRSDLLAIRKPSGTGIISTCPAKSGFKLSQDKVLLDQTNHLLFTPEPAVQTDPAKTGYVVATPGDASTLTGAASHGDHLGIITVTEDASGDVVFPATELNLTIPPYQAPPPAPQKRVVAGGPGRRTGRHHRHTVYGI